LQLPATYMNQALADINIVTRGAQPWHSQILHITVTNVVEM
jgi:hypothetical protein